MRNRSRLLKTQHFAEEGSLARQVNPCAPVVYERRWNCKLKIAAGALPAFIVTRRLMASVLPRKQTVR